MLADASTSNQICKITGKIVMEEQELRMECAVRMCEIVDANARSFVFLRSPGGTTKLGA